MSDEPPRMSTEPPAGYVAFVAANLERLRRDAATVVGDERDADLLYPAVLTDVALRWEYLQLLRKRLGKVGIADEYLSRAFTRRSMQWQSQQDEDAVDIHVWSGDGPPPPAVYFTERGLAEAEPYEPKPTRNRSSAAVRLASLLDSSGRTTTSPIAEASIAWLHAHATRQRYRLIAIVAAVLLVMSILSRFSVTGAN
jgi:hypothetical protein